MNFVTAVKFQKADKHRVQFTGSAGEILKISILEDKIFRVSLKRTEDWVLGKTWSIAPGLDGLPFEGRDRDSREGFSFPGFQLKRESTVTEVSTTSLKLRITHSPLKLSWYDVNSNLEIHQDRDELAYARTAKGWQHFSKRDEKDLYFGLGEKTGSQVRNERRFEMRNVDAMGYDPDLSDPLYKHIPFYICQKPQIAYGIFYDNLSQSVFDFGAERENYFGFFTSYFASEGDLDFYFILGPQIKEVTKTFSWMTGKTFFAPLHSLHYSGSTMGYTEGKNAQGAISQFLKDCERHEIKVGSFQLSSGYCMHGNLRHVFVWNKEKFPNFAELSEQAKNQKVTFSANIKPVMFSEHPEFDASLLIEAKGKPEKSYFWDGFASHFDFSKAKTRKWWKKKITSELLEKGVLSTWNDNNEFHIRDEKAQLSGFKKSIPVSQVRPVLSLLMCQTSFAAHIEHAPKERPWLITRAGGPGLQRYAQTWTGDNRTSWRSLKMNLQTGLGLSLSGIYNWGIDVGGFSGPTPEPELFLRWIQQGIFYPRFTIHSWKADGTVTEPWMYPEILPLVKAAMHLREELMPYIYHQFYLAHKNSEPIARPLIWEAVNKQTLAFSDQFYLGENLLICPVTEKSSKKISVYLPSSAGGWWNYLTKKWYAADQVLEFPVELASIFLFVRANSALVVERSGTLTLLLFPSPVDLQNEWRFFKDDGRSFNYLQGQYFSLEGSLSSKGSKLQMDLRKSGKHSQSFVIESQDPIHINGKAFSSGETVSF